MKLTKTNFLNYKSLLFFLIILFALIVRTYNINYDNLWSDEISSFWITNPELSFKNSFFRHNLIEQIPYLYHLVLNLTFHIFFYDPLYGRYLSVIFNFFGIIISTLLIKKISKNNSYIFALFLFSSNIFLINYSQEMRPYSMIFFLCSVNLYMLFLLDQKKNNTIISYKYFILISFFQSLLLASHPFGFIVFFSIIFYFFINYIKKKTFNKTLGLSLIIVSIFSIFYLSYFFVSQKTFTSWIVNPDFKFYTNFYFSNFFGSRFLGLFHLIFLILLIFRSLKKNEKEKNFFNIFFIIIIFSYLLPISYGYIFNPIIVPRYIIFVLIPIISIISILTFRIRNRIIKNLIIFLFVFLNFGNHFTESTFKQFFTKRPYYKPNFEVMSEIILESNTKNFFIEMNNKNIELKYYYDAIANYIKEINKKKMEAPVYIKRNDFYNSNFNKSWIICLPNVSEDKCYNNKEIFNKNFQLEKNVPGINMILINNESKN